MIDFSKFDTHQTKVLKSAVDAGYDPTSFADPQYDWAKMQLAYHAMRNGNNLVPYLSNFDFDQLEEIRIGLRSKLDVSSFAKPEINAEEMHLLRLKLEDENN